MSKKSYFTVIALIVVAIVITLGVFNVQSIWNNRNVKATLIIKSRQEGFEFWEIVVKGAQEAAKEFNVTLSVDGPMNEEDIDGQIAIVKKAIAQQPDVIVLAAVDQDALLPYAQEITQKGIKLVLVDSGLSKEVEDCFVGTNNFAAAQKVGDVMGKAMGSEGGKLAIISHQMSTSTAVQRTEGFKDRIRNYPAVELTGTYDIGDSSEKSRITTLRVLQENPQIKGIFATNQISAEGVTKALEQSGRSDILFYAFDSSTIQNEALEKGIIDGFAVQMPFNMGYMAVKMGVEASNGTLRNKNFDTGYAFATKENMHEQEIQKLIYPFVK